MPVSGHVWCERWLYRWFVVEKCGKKFDPFVEHFWGERWIELIAAVKRAGYVDMRNRNENPAYF